MSLLMIICILEPLVRRSQGCEVITKCCKQFEARHCFEIPYSYYTETLTACIWILANKNSLNILVASRIH